MTQTLLPLDDFRRALGYSPWHFWGMSDSAKLPVTSACNDLLYKYAYQGADQAGRSEIADAIRMAEERLANYLGWWIAPFYEEVTVPWPQYFDAGLSRIAAVQPPWHRLVVRLPKGKIRKIGYRRFSAISLAEVITYADSDGDGVNDTWSISFATTVTDPDQIAVYFQASERWEAPDVTDPDAMAPYRIQPVNIKIVAGTATVQGRTWLMGLPGEQEKGRALNPTVVADLSVKLDAYRLYYDPTGLVASESQAVLLWDTEPYAHGWWCCCPSCTVTTTPPSSAYDPAAEGYALARAGIHDIENGLVVPAQAVYNAASGVWVEQGFGACREPDRVKVRVLSGYPLERSNVADRMRVLVARMAMAELSEDICACKMANRELHRWQFDMSRAAGANDEQFAISQKDLANPFGTRRGHIFAWREVESLAMIRGFSA